MMSPPVMRQSHLLMARENFVMLALIMELTVGAIVAGQLLQNQTAIVVAAATAVDGKEQAFIMVERKQNKMRCSGGGICWPEDKRAKER